MEKWVELGLKEYSYILSQWYPDEPPPCIDEVTVRVKDHVVVGAQTVSCETKVKTQAEPEGLKTLRTFDEMYDDCREKVFAEAPSFARLSLWLDAKGVLSHCQFYEPYWGYHSGGRLTL